MSMRGSAYTASRRRALALLGAALWGGAPPGAFAQAHGAGLPTARSLAAELRQALAARRALVVMVSLDGCPYCKVVRENYLLPLARQGQPVVQLDMGHADAVTDAAGRTATHESLIRALGVRVAPTVLFLGPGGREVAARLEGVPLIDFYGAYLDERVLQANRAAAA